MKKKKAAAYLTVIASLLALSIVTPLVINTVSDTIAGWIRSSEKETETDETERLTGDELTELSMETESDHTDMEGSEGVSGGASHPDHGKTLDEEERTIILEDTYYEEPMYSSASEEDAANKRTYQDMTEKLLSLSEASETYRKNFHPGYDELKAGLMNAFISGREEQFYEDLANYCFGHYNTSYQIRKVRFDALIEETNERQTVILEFFTAEDLKNERYIPDLKLCTYNKQTQAFVFFSGAGR